MEVAVMVFGVVAALAVWGMTVALQRLAVAERQLGIRARTVRALADLVAGRS